MILGTQTYATAMITLRIWKASVARTARHMERSAIKGGAVDFVTVEQSDLGLQNIVRKSSLCVLCDLHMGQAMGGWVVCNLWFLCVC